jgi:hypothetical protein
MAKKHSRRHQKLYRMKGCSTKTCKKYLGGSADVNLAYPSNNVPTVPNPYLAYTGKGGSCSSNLINNNLAQPQNINGQNPIYPSTGPVSTGFNFLNPSNMQKGGKKRRYTKGGSCSTCGTNMGYMVGGQMKHRFGCKCSECKMQTGGTGNNGIPYPNGLTGSPWSTGGILPHLPGVNGIQGDNNFYELNKYAPNDVSRQMVDVGANPPYIIGGRHSRRRKQRGGTLSNFLGQDLINLGRQFQFGVGSAYNALAGYQAPVNPLPWKQQLPSTPSLSAVKANLI